MGPRGAARRSEGEVISEQNDKLPLATASRWRELWRCRGTWAYVALLTAVSVVCAFLPLADHLGYELAEIVALCAGAFGAAPGVAAARTEIWRNRADAAPALGAAVLAGLTALTIPLGIILLNGLRRPVCDPLAGLVLYVALAVPSGALAAALGVACGFAAHRRAGWIVAAVFAATLFAALWPIARGPQIFAFHHLGGWFPGPIYDEAIRPTRALWIFRAGTILYAGACAGAALLAGPGLRRTAGLVALVACGAPAAWLSLHAERFHFRASAAGLAGHSRGQGHLRRTRRDLLLARGGGSEQARKESALGACRGLTLSLLSSVRMVRRVCKCRGSARVVSPTGVRRSWCRRRGRSSRRW